MLTSFSDFERGLQTGRLERNYFLFGPDSYLLEAARNALIQALERAHGGGTLTDTLDLDEVSIDDVLNAAKETELTIHGWRKEHAAGKCHDQPDTYNPTPTARPTINVMDDAKENISIHRASLL